MPDFTTNLLSVMRLYTEGKATCFHPDVGVLIADAKDVTLQCKKPLAIGTIRDGSFQVDVLLPINHMLRLSNRLASVLLIL
jgi:hypothetical protein